MEHDVFFICLFKNDEVILADHEQEFMHGPHKIEPGTNLVARCKVNDTGGGRFGFMALHAFEVSINKPVRKISFLKAVCGHPRDGARILPSDYLDEMKNIRVSSQLIKLSALQSSNLIRAIERDRAGSAWYSKATREFKTALQVVFTKGDKARDLVRQGAEFALKGKFDEAKKLIEEGLTIYPELGAARVDLGKIAIEQGHVSEAIKWFKDELALAKEPLHLSAHSYLAAIFQAMGELDKTDMHVQSGMSTEAYRRMSSSLAPEVVEKIRRVVQKKRI